MKKTSIPSLMGASTESLCSVAVPSRERTAIILDWDDTLLCSTWLSSQDVRLDNAHLMKADVREELRELEKRVAKFLDRAICLGTVFLVTNAETGWIELSCQRFLPGLLPYLSKVKVISARSKYENYFPNQPSAWKTQAFRAELVEFIGYDVLGDSATIGSGNVISIGDSHHEREALHAVTSEWDNVLVKSVKFVERPDTELLRKQLDLIHGCIEYICQHDGDLDLMLSHSLLVSADGDIPSSPGWVAHNNNNGPEGITAMTGL